MRADRPSQDVGFRRHTGNCGIVLSSVRSREIDVELLALIGIWLMILSSFLTAGPQTMNQSNSATLVASAFPSGTLATIRITAAAPARVQFASQFA